MRYDLGAGELIGYSMDAAIYCSSKGQHPLYEATIASMRDTLGVRNLAHFNDYFFRARAEVLDAFDLAIEAQGETHEST